MAQNLGFPTKCLLSRMHYLLRDYCASVKPYSFADSENFSAENQILKGNAAYFEGL